MIFDDEKDALWLLAAAQLAVMNATNGNARAVRADLVATLRKVTAGAPERISGRAKMVLLASDFLSNLAWTDSVDPVLLDRQRDSFADAMDHLIREIGRTRIKAPAKQVDDTVPYGHRRLILAKTKFALTMKGWAAKSKSYGRSFMLGPRATASEQPRRHRTQEGHGEQH